MPLFRSKVIRYLAALVLVLAAGTGSYVALRGRDLKLPELFPPPQERILMSMEGFAVSQFQRGVVVWRATAATADLLENRQARLEGLEILHTDPVRGNVVLRGDQGVLDTVSGDARILSRTSDVRVVSADGYLLTTSSLTWTAAERLMTTTNAFRLLGPKIYLEGKGVTASIDQKTVVVESNVKAVLQE